MNFAILADEEGKKKFELDSRGVYVKPAGANCIMVYAGKVAFGKTVFTDDFKLVGTNIGAIYFKKARTGRRFFKLPTALEKEEIEVSFPEYIIDKHGHNYGTPVFMEIPLVPCGLLVPLFR